MVITPLQLIDIVLNYISTCVTGLPSVVEDRIISTLSLSPSIDETVSNENNTEDQSEPPFCLESSFQDVNQDITQDVSLETDTHAPAPEMFTLDQVEGHSEAENVVELESRCSIQEEVNDIEESIVYEIEEGTMNTSQSECEDKASAEADVLQNEDVPEEEASVEAEGPEPSSVTSGTDLDPGDVVEGGDETSEEAPTSNTGQRLKVVVPRHLIPIIKQVRLPSVSLSRCTSSESGQLK